MGLLLLRLSVAAQLFVGGRLALPGLPWLLPCLIAVTVLLCFGVMTPLLAAFCGMLELAGFLATGAISGSTVALAITNAAALALLGPGGYSVDACLFGRRIISLRSRHDQHNR
jgi:hypothetical protein